MITISLAQFDVQPGRRAANLERAMALAAEARGVGAEVMLLPELWLDGYDLEHAPAYASTLGEGAFAQMATVARRAGCYVSGSLLERHSGGISNTSAFYSPDGTLMASYRKIHLFRLMREDRFLAAGDRAVLVTTPWGPVGLAICYDLRFPELFRTLALAGAVMFLLPAQWPARRLDAWLLLARARAVENELFFAACNRVGCDGDTIFPGHSLFADPWGNVLAEGDDAERLVVAQANLQELRKVRRYLTVYEDRRPDAYHIRMGDTH